MTMPDETRDLGVFDDGWDFIAVADNYFSLIWTERWQAMGDFEVQVENTLENQELFKLGNFVTVRFSFRAMVIESQEEKFDSNKGHILVVRGRGLEYIMKYRVLRDSISTRDPIVWTTTSPTLIAEDMAEHVLEPPGAAGTSNAIDEFVSGGLLLFDREVDGMGPDALTPIALEVEPMVLYDAVKDIAEQYGFGFILGKERDAKEIKFQSYGGRNLSEGDGEFSLLEGAVLGPQFGNVEGITRFSSIQELYTQVQVDTPSNSRRILLPGTSTSSWKHRVHLMKIDPQEVTDVNAEMDRQGAVFLRQHQAAVIFEVEVEPLTLYGSLDIPYRYGAPASYAGNQKTFQVGDYFYVHWGEHRFKQRVVEYTMTLDAQGEKGNMALESLYEEPDI